MILINTIGQRASQFFPIFQKKITEKSQPSELPKLWARPENQLQPAFVEGALVKNEKESFMKPVEKFFKQFLQMADKKSLEEILAQDKFASWNQQFAPSGKRLEPEEELEYILAQMLSHVLFGNFKEEARELLYAAQKYEVQLPRRITQVAQRYFPEIDIQSRR